MTDKMVAALFVDPKGTYALAFDVDLWDEKQDARNYKGPYPVVAHPPCARWCRLAGLVEKRWGHKRGDDGGCFASALKSVHTYGGVLEHPAYSDAWAKFNLPRPSRHGGWVSGKYGYSCHVEQGRYGHVAKKATWLYVYGLGYFPPMRFGFDPDQRSKALVSWCGNHVASGEARPRVGKAAAATPLAFRDLLLEMARSVSL